MVGVPIVIAVLVASAASTIYMDSSEDFNQDVEKLINDITEDVMTYIEIKGIIGRYNGTGEKREIDKILILMKLLFDGSINVSDLKVGVDDGKSMILMGYNGFATLQGSGSLFDIAVWGKGFGLIVILDRDNSICEESIINHGDVFFMAIELPSSFHVKAGDDFRIYVVPPSGTIRMMDIYAPFSCSTDIVLLG